MEELRTDELKENTRWVSREASDLLKEVGTLLRQEMDLAACELAEKAKEARGAGTRLGVGGVLGHAGALVIAGAFVVLFTWILQTWMATLPAALISSAFVGIVLAAIGLALVRSAGKELAPDHFVPRRTIECMKEDARWLKTRLG